MEPEIRKILLWLYQDNQLLYKIYNLHRVIMFSWRRVNSYFVGRTHQTQLIDNPKLQFFF